MAAGEHEVQEFFFVEALHIEVCSRCDIGGSAGAYTMEYLSCGHVGDG